MAKKFRNLKFEDRLKIQAMCAEGKKVIEIADELKVHRATIYNELIRGGAGNGKRKEYNANLAQQKV